MFVIGIIFAIVAILLLAYAMTLASRTRVELRKPDRYSDPEEVRINGSRKWFLLGSGAAFALALLFTFFASIFNVDTGSSVVLKDWSGVVQEDAVTTAGFHTKAPWQNDIAWDIKNQDVTFTGDGSTTHDGQQVAGAEIVFTDKDGITAPMDIQVLFSIKADAIVPLTKGFTDQNDFQLKVVENDVKSIPRDIAGSFTTVEMFSERPRLRAEIVDALTEAWADKGVIVENVNIHGIRYPDDVQQRFKDAQNAETDLLKAETDAKTAKTKADGEAQAEIARAQGEAEANRLLSQSLTPQVLQQRWIDALSKSQTIIVPNDFTSLGTIPQPQG